MTRPLILISTLLVTIGLVATTGAVNPAAADLGDIVTTPTVTVETPIITVETPPVTVPDPPPTEPDPTPTEPAPTPTEPAPTPTDPAPTPTDPAPTPTDPAPTPTDPAPTPTPTDPAVVPPASTNPAPTPTTPGIAAPTTPARAAAAPVSIFGPAGTPLNPSPVIGTRFDHRCRDGEPEGDRTGRPLVAIPPGRRRHHRAAGDDVGARRGGARRDVAVDRGAGDGYDRAGAVVADGAGCLRVARGAGRQHVAGAPGRRTGARRPARAHPRPRWCAVAGRRDRRTAPESLRPGAGRSTAGAARTHPHRPATLGVARLEQCDLRWRRGFLRARFEAIAITPGGETRIGTSDRYWGVRDRRTARSVAAYAGLLQDLRQVGWHEAPATSLWYRAASLSPGVRWYERRLERALQGRRSAVAQLDHRDADVAVSRAG